MKCERCYQESRATIMSMFNTDVICIPCRKKEESHPRYEEAVRAEQKSILNGDMNYPGIGKPKNL